MRNLIDMIEVPEVGLVATEVLNEYTPNIHEAVKEAEVYSEYPFDPDSTPGDLILPHIEMHRAVAALGQVHNQPYTLPTVEQYQKIIKFSKGDKPQIVKLKESIFRSCDVINGEIVQTEDGEKLHQNFKFRKRTPEDEPSIPFRSPMLPKLEKIYRYEQSWIKTKGEYVAKPKGVKIGMGVSTALGVGIIAVTPLCGKPAICIEAIEEESDPWALLGPTGRVILSK